MPRHLKLLIAPCNNVLHFQKPKIRSITPYSLDDSHNESQTAQSFLDYAFTEGPSALPLGTLHNLRFPFLYPKKMSSCVLFQKVDK